jgi:hypothetical protein
MKFGRAEQRRFPWPARSTNTSSAAPATWPLSSAGLQRRLVDRPPRAQLMMRTPFLVLARFRPRMLRVWSVSGVCSVMKSARASSVVELDLLDAHFDRALRRQERIEGDDLHLQAERAVGDDASRYCRADQAERLAGDFDAHEAVLLPLAGLGRGVGGGDLAREREHQRDGVLGRGDRIAERRVHHDHALGRRGRNVDIVDADAGAADDLQVGRGGEDFLRHLGRAERMARPS